MTSQYIKQIIDTINNIYDPKKQLASFNRYFEFKHVFSEKGVQGTAGLLYHRTNSKVIPVVFKIPSDVNFSIEHEKQVLDTLQGLNCKNFIQAYGIVTLPINGKFLDKEKGAKPFINSSDTVLMPVLLIEYAGNIENEKILPAYAIDDFIYDNRKDKHVIFSQLLQLLMALQVAQDYYKFTHYDLHLNNIYMVKCNKNLNMVYKRKKETFIVPTYGWYPVIIDVGVSFINSFNGKPISSHVDHYAYGFQSSIFDALNDVHHCLFIIVDAFKDIIKNTDNKEQYISSFGFFSRYLDNSFKSLELNKKRGWKLLPNDFSKLMIKEIKTHTNCWKITSFKENYVDVLTLLNSVIILPFKPSKDVSRLQFVRAMEFFLDEMHKFYISEYSLDTLRYLNILKDFIIIFNKHRDKYFSSITIKKISGTERIENESKNIDYDFKDVHKEFKKYGINVNYKQLFESADIISKYMSNFYYILLKDHVHIIEKSYNSVPLDSPLDMFKIIYRNCTPHFTITNQSKFSVYNMDNRKTNEGKCSNLEKINNVSMKNKTKYIE